MSALEKCDGCGNAQRELAWELTNRTQTWGANALPKHFCSKTCIALWLDMRGLSPEAVKS